MKSYRPQLASKPANAVNVEALLRGIQEDIERFGSERVKQRRRAILKGYRAGLWTMANKPRLGDVALMLRAELFGHPLPVGHAIDDELCHPGTDEEVMK